MEYDTGIKEKLEFFMDEKIKIHIKKKDRQFLNGFIIEKKQDNVFVMNEDKLGKILLFVCDVWLVSVYREVKL